MSQLLEALPAKLGLYLYLVPKIMQHECPFFNLKNAKYNLLVLEMLAKNTAVPRFTTQSRLLMTLKLRPLENIVGKGENADNQRFLLFPE